MYRLNNKEVEFEVTNLCNNQCLICPRGKMTRKKGTMQLDLFKKLIDSGVRMGLKNILLAGFGEPFLDKTLFEKVKYAKSCGLKVSADTNGYFIDRKTIDSLISNAFDYLRFSIFSSHSQIFKKLHGFDGYRKVISNLMSLLKKRKKTKNHLPKVGIYYVEYRENVSETKDFIRMWQDKVDELSVWKPHNWINTYRIRKGRKRKKACLRPLFGPLQIRWNGDVVPCCFDFNNEMIVGNVSSGSYDDLFEDVRYKKVIEAHKKGDLSEYPLCSRCDQLYDTPDALIYTTDKKVRMSFNRVPGVPNLK